jgi:hypothetical protein
LTINGIGVASVSVTPAPNFVSSPAPIIVSAITAAIISFISALP